MAVEAEYLGLSLSIDDLDVENLEYFRYCAQHDFHLQRCKACGLLVYPPRTACPWCAAADFEWAPLQPKGAVHSYSEVHHAIQPGFKAHTPYLILIVDLDTQKGQPGENDALRVAANLATPDGEMAPPQLVKQVGIGSRMRMVFKDVADGISLPMWTLDEDAAQPHKPWRYPQE
ncbi:MAG: OB-fold domain-containing protein [Dehalococcoidia bacterium]